MLSPEPSGLWRRADGHAAIGDLPGAWVEMPEASYGVFGKGGEQLLSFAPKPPPKAPR